MITFELSKEQALILKSAKEFAAGELKEIARDCDEDNKIPKKPRGTYEQPASSFSCWSLVGWVC